MAKRRIGLALLCLIAVSAISANAWADGSGLLPSTQHAELVPSVFGAELHVGAVLPFVDELCPPSASARNACLLNEGLGIGASMERRWTFGGALLLGYDVSLLSGSGVYEVGVLQSLRVGAKWVVPLETTLKPYFELSLGALLFGDSFTVATAGGSVQFGVGGELEFGENIALTFGVVFRGFTTGTFITPNDSVARGTDPGANLALLTQIGVLYLEN